MSIEHKDITEANLHEPKGVSSAAINKVYVSDGAGSGTWQKVAAAQIDSLTATIAEINNECDVSAKAINAGGTLTIVEATHAGKVIKLDTAAGSVITLPVPTGTGAVYVFTVSTIATSNSHIIKVADVNGVMRGVIHTIDTDTGDVVASWGTALASDTITLNRSTTGSVYVGETITIIDVASNVWAVSGFVGVVGAPATPFSATV